MIELLVVIAIIALLAGLIITGTIKARDQARAAVCTMNLRNLAVALTSVIDGRQGWLPARLPVWQTEAPEDWTWYAQGEGGMTDPHAFICGANTFRTKGMMKGGPTTSYSIHAGLRDMGGPIASVNYTKPSKTGLLVDGTHNWLKESQPERVARVHRDGSANILYLDGHVDIYVPDGFLDEFFYQYTQTP